MKASAKEKPFLAVISKSVSMTSCQFLSAVKFSQMSS